MKAIKSFCKYSLVQQFVLLANNEGEERGHSSRVGLYSYPQNKNYEFKVHNNR
jgi:hypothetical protein